MHCSDAEIDYSGTPRGKGRVLGVIVLTDNRQDKASDKKLLPSYKSSGFKDTEVDPLQFSTENATNSQNQNTIAQLSLRLKCLQERVEALSKNEVLDAATSKAHNCHLRKKNRRKFKQLERNHICQLCQKMYGSDTSLKYHMKLKHSEAVNLAQVQ